MPRRLPDGFMLGCATAAHQVEGGTENDWSRWTREHPDRIADRSDASVAIDHYRRYPGDLAQLAASHQDAHRFSVEWSRVEPQPGCFDRDALDHYADVVRTCSRLGLEPIVTLLHFTLPDWLASIGGVARPDAPRLFARYVATCAEVFGENVTWWVTINEPAVQAILGHLYGTWPPGEHSVRRTNAALHGLLRMHAAGAYALRAVAAARGSRVRVSIAHHERRQRARRSWSPIDQTAALLTDFIFNRWFLRCCATGRLLPPLGRGQRVPLLAGSLDYIGLNYYADDVVSIDVHAPSTGFVTQAAHPDLPHTGFGWSIEPAGLRRALNALWRTFRLPILITENGVADDHDELRPAFIHDFIEATLDALDDGVDVRGYLHWTAWDNFEWAEGYTKRFGLHAVNRDTLERTAKPSAVLYADICRTRTLPPEGD